VQVRVLNGFAALCAPFAGARTFQANGRMADDAAQIYDGRADTDRGI
jgi:hypothetical protein